MVPVIIQHTADYKRDGDNRKRMMSDLGDKVNKKCPVCFSTTRNFFFVLTTCNHSSCILSFVVFFDLM